MSIAARRPLLAERRFVRFSVCMLLFILPALASAQGPTSGSVTLYPNNTTIHPSLNSSVTSTSSEIVTMGVPFDDCTLTNTDHFRLFTDMALTDEVSIYIETTLEWPDTRKPCEVESIRAVKVQFEYDATGGAPDIYYWDIDAGGRGLADRPEVAVSEVAHDNPIKLGLMEPRVFAIHDPDYVVQSRILPPTSPLTTDDYDTGYYPEKWQFDSRDFDYSTTQFGHWLFDRVSTNYRQAMRRGEVDHFREAYISHEFYIGKIEVTGANTSEADYCIGGFDFGGVADTFGSGGKGCDSKYIYSQPILLHLALTGDDSWEPSENGTPSIKADTRDKLFKAMADLLFQGSLRTGVNVNNPAVPAQGFSQPYTNVGEPYTERKPGLGLQTLLAICALIPDDPDVCGWVDTVVDNMYGHQTSNPDGRGNVGYLAHSWRQHEGTGSPYLGTLVSTYAGATTVVIENTFIGGVDELVAGNFVRIGGVDIELLAPPVSNLDGTWDLSLASGASGSSGSTVTATFVDSTFVVENLAYNQSPDRAFSPWMQSMIVDGLWGYYYWTDDLTQKTKTEDLLQGLARAYINYGIDGTRTPGNTEDLIELAFPGSIIYDSAISASVGCGMVKAPYTRYVGNDLMVTNEMNEAYKAFMFVAGGFSDQHIPEGLFQLSLGIYFETDPDIKAAMQQVASDMLEWFEVYACTSGNQDLGSPLNDPPRTFNWQNKPDPFGTYHWVTNHAISFDTETFVEVLANNGAISNTITVSLGSDKFTDAVFTSPTHYEVTGLPSGLSAVVTRTGDRSATFALTGTADDHEFLDSITTLGLEFKDAAFQGGVAFRVTDSVKTDLAITYVQPMLLYDVSVLNENVANDGSFTESFTITLQGDTFMDDGDFGVGDEFTVTNLPAILVVSATL